MSKLRRFLLIAVAVLPGGVAADQVNLKELRMWHAPDHTRVVFDISAPVRYKTFTLDQPLRLVIDVENAKFNGTLPAVNALGPLISGIRHGAPANNQLRLVLDLRRRIDPKSFQLLPNESYGHRLVLDLYPDAGPGSSKPVQQAPTPTPKPVVRSGPFIVIVDAGHGGEDPGAIGRRRSREKNIVLAIARKLHDRINAASGMRSVMTRQGDYYISLRRRTEIARKNSADLFVSIHADAFKRSSARGSSVYALSQRGATSETARWLAQKENASDLAGGVKLSDKDALLRRVLLDLSMTKTVSESIVFGKDVLGGLKRIGPVHSQRVEQAGFVVLKSPDIPSILVETGYITNPTEEKLLNSNAHQSKVADAIFRGIQSYLRKRPRPQGAQVASATTSQSSPKFYVVKPGDNLSLIAKRFGVSLSALRKINKITGNGNVIFVGKKLRIPAS